MDFSIIILNYQNYEMTKDCILSCISDLKSAHDISWKIIVVDNCSHDGSFEKLSSFFLENEFNEKVKVVMSDSNKGFSYGMNFGIKSQLAERYILLNNDILIKRGFFEEIVKETKKLQKLVFGGPVLCSQSEEVQNSVFNEVGLKSEFLRVAKTSLLDSLFGYKGSVSADMESIDWISFACVIISGEVFKDLGLLDEEYFMYFEDVDFCRRAKKRGWKIKYIPKARAIHLRGKSSPVKKLMRRRERLPEYYYQSRKHYFKKFYGPYGLILANVFWFSGRGISKLRELIGNKKEHLCKDEWRDIWA